MRRCIWEVVEQIKQIPAPFMPPVLSTFAKQNTLAVYFMRFFVVSLSDKSSGGCGVSFSPPATAVNTTSISTNIHKHVLDE